MGITGGTLGYAFLDALPNSDIEISFTLPSAASDAYDSALVSTSFSLASLGVSALAITLTFEAVVERCDVRDASHFTRPTAVLSDGTMSTSTGSSIVRLPFSFARNNALCATFDAAFSVGTWPFSVPFPFNGGCSPSRELEAELSLQVGGLGIAFSFRLSASAFCFL